MFKDDLPSGRALERIAIAIAMAMAISAAPSWAADATQRCQIKKLRAAEKHATCIGRAKRRAVVGQTTDTAACDAAFRSARDAAGDCRFLDNGDQTVSDLDTGLTWGKKVDGAGCLHCVQDQYDWTSAMSAWLSEVNGPENDEGPPHAGGLGGHSDWRIPTDLELDSLRDPTSPSCEGDENCIHPIVGPATSGHHWSSISLAGDLSQALVVGFSRGTPLEIFSAAKTELRAVRAVRGTFIGGSD
jgi:hypothetical protein